MLPSSPLYPRACRVCVLVVSFVAFSVKLSVAKAAMSFGKLDPLVRTAAEAIESAMPNSVL